MAKNKLYEAIETVKDVDVLNEMQNEFNALCENRKKHLQILDEASNINTKSFFYIKESFENLSETLFESEKGRKLINRYVKEHRNNKDLQKMFFIHENITMADKTLNINDMLNEMKSIVGNINEKKLNEGIDKLVSLLKEAYIEVGEASKTKLSRHNDFKLDEAIKYVFNNNKKLDNLTYYNICMNEIKKHIENNPLKENVFEKRVDLDEILENFNKDFSIETMGEENFKIVKEINESENKSEIFEKYKDECIKTIDEAINSNLDQNTCNQLFEFKTRLQNKTFNPDTLGRDIANFIELKNTVNE